MKLRVITICATLLLIPYYLLQKDSLIAAAIWNTVFIVINVWRLRRDNNEPI